MVKRPDKASAVTVIKNHLRKMKYLLVKCFWLSAVFTSICGESVRKEGCLEGCFHFVFSFCRSSLGFLQQK